MQQADVLPHFDKVFPPKHQKISKRGRPVTFLRRKGSSRDNNVYYYSDSSDEDDRIQSKCKRGEFMTIKIIFKRSFVPINQRLINGFIYYDGEGIINREY